MKRILVIAIVVLLASMAAWGQGYCRSERLETIQASGGYGPAASAKLTVTNPADASLVDLYDDLALTPAKKLDNPLTTNAQGRYHYCAAQGITVKETWTGALITAGWQIVSLGSDLTVVSNTLNAHVSASQAHGATGALVGRSDLNAGTLDANVRTLTSSASVVGFRAVSTNATLTATDYIVTCNAAAGTVTMTVPTAVGQRGRLLLIKKLDASENRCECVGTSGQTFEGDLKLSISTKGATALIVSDGANWLLIG